MKIPDELLARLPPLLAQEADADPIVYSRFHLPGTNRCWYVTEASPSGDDLIFFGLVYGEDAAFQSFTLSALTAIRSADGQAVELDASFSPGRLTDVVPPPDY